MSTGRSYAVVRAREESKRRQLEERRQRELERQRLEAEKHARLLAEEKQRLAELSHDLERIDAELKRYRAERHLQMEALLADANANLSQNEHQIQSQMAAIKVDHDIQQHAYENAQARLDSIQRQLSSIERMDIDTFEVFHALQESFSAFAQLELQAIEQEGEGYLVRFANDVEQDAYTQLQPLQDDRIGVCFDLTAIYGEQNCRPLLSSITADLETSGIVLQHEDETIPDLEKPNWELIRRPSTAASDK